MRNAYKIYVGKTEGKKPLGRPRGKWEGNIRLDLKRYRMRRREPDASGSGQGPVVGSRKHGDELSGSIKGEEFLDCLSDCQPLKDCAPWS
jgi:hypothetical protein